MKIFRSFEEVKKAGVNRPIITWGVFDGVHRGHQFLFKNITTWAERIKSPSLIITFQNHPERILKGHEEPLFLASLEHRVLLFEQLDINCCLILEFTRKLSSLTAEEFLHKVIQYINPVGMVVTDNILFGRGGKGDVHLLRKVCKENNIALKVIKTLKTKAKTISSSLIRQEIQDSNLKSAAQMLGRPVSILGTVVHGEGRGKKLGFPTANLDPHHEIMPPNGVYIARATLYPRGVFCSKIHSQTYNALVNVGTRPTFHFNGETGIEVFLKDYTQHGWNYLYGKDMLVEIICKLRDECKFPNPEALIKQIHLDLKALQKECCL